VRRKQDRFVLFAQELQQLIHELAPGQHGEMARLFCGRQGDGLTRSAMSLLSYERQSGLIPDVAQIWIWKSLRPESATVLNPMRQGRGKTLAGTNS
jgi:hypothetical protein